MEFPPELYGSVWHTTTPNRYRRILNDGFILPEPEIPDDQRWGTANGREHFPFVRSLGGVSLFDFRSFDPRGYCEKYPRSMWRSFVPCLQGNAESVWVEIDLKHPTSKIIEGCELVECWKQSGQLNRKIMPYIEIAHIGPISTLCFSRVFIYKRAECRFIEI